MGVLILIKKEKYKAKLIVRWGQKAMGLIGNVSLPGYQKYPSHADLLPFIRLYLTFLTILLQHLVINRSFLNYLGFTVSQGKLKIERKVKYYYLM